MTPAWICSSDPNHVTFEPEELTAPCPLSFYLECFCKVISTRTSWIWTQAIRVGALFQIFLTACTPEAFAQSCSCIDECRLIAGGHEQAHKSGDWGCFWQLDFGAFIRSRVLVSSGRTSTLWLVTGIFPATDTTSWNLCSPIKHSGNESYLCETLMFTLVDAVSERLIYLHGKFCN